MNNRFFTAEAPGPKRSIVDPRKILVCLSAEEAAALLQAKDAAERDAWWLVKLQSMGAWANELLNVLLVPADQVNVLFAKNPYWVTYK